MEAMLFELPCVVTAAGGMPELFPDRESGIIVGVRDHESMGRAILRLAEEPRLRETMGKNGRSAILGNFSVDAYARGVLAMYRALLD
jgi:glycosyltransferase involved in cell wall biosynthesis